MHINSSTIKHLMYAKATVSRCDPKLMHDTCCVQNVWSELTGNTHFNINELPHNDVKVSTTQQDSGVGRTNGRAQLATDSLVINHL